jgi:hypothetical protein
MGMQVDLSNRGKRFTDRSMQLSSRYLISILGAALAALCFGGALAVPATLAGHPATLAGQKPASSTDSRIFDSSIFDSTMFDTVNRASKGDRMRVIARPPDAEPFEVQLPAGSSPKSLDGCESAFGQMDHSSAARLAQNCVT